MFGETDVDPAALFDPGRGESPPGDAFDLYFPAPVSVSVLCEELARTGRDGELGRVLDLYLDVARGTVTDVQRHGGYVSGGHQGRAVPARLELAAVAEQSMPDTAAMRLHTHLYVGRSAVALSTGDRHPVAVDRLTRAANLAWRAYLGRLVDTSSDVLGWVWGALPGHHPADEEIIVPPLAQHIGNQTPGVCPGTHSPREQIRADAHWRTGIAEMTPYLGDDTPAG